MLRFTALIAVLGLAACSTTQSTYGNQMSYRPKNSTGAPWIVTPKLDWNIWSGQGHLALSVNDKLVIEGDLSPLDNSGAFVGSYKKHIVNASCRPKLQDTDCQVFIDAELVGSF